MKAYGATILRVVLGIFYVLYAYQELVVLTPAGFSAFMAKVTGFPAPAFIAWVVIVVHGFGGILLVLGLWTRLAAAANAVVTLGALLTVHLTQGFFLKAVVMDAAAGRAEVQGYAFVLLQIAASVAVVFLGPGPWAVKR